MSDSKAGTSSREELAMILDNVADGVLATDVEGRVIFANRAAAQMLGKESGPPLEGTLASEACLPFLDEMGRPVVPDELPQQRALRGERSKEALLGCRREGEGQTRWLLVKSDPITGPDGSVRSVVTIFRDVTTSRAAEDALRAANEALRAVVRSSPLPIIVLDTDLTIRLWNPAAQKTFGWSEEEVIGKRSPLITSELEAESALFAAQVASGAEVPPLETTRVTRQGDVLDVTVWATSFTSPEGRRQLLGIVADSTEARRATAERERLLRQIETERNFLRVILDQLPVGARVANAAGEIIFANQELLRIWGDGDEGHWTGFHPDGRPYQRTDWPIFRAVREQREIVNEEIEIVRADRSGGTLLASSAPVRDADGEIVGGVSVLADITERKRAEMGARFLAQASHILTSSLDHRVTLREVARLAVPWLADWCSVHLRKRDGSIGSVAIEHGDPERR
ncbi:MAG TPA: PAS domain S-box protein, partial [Thermoanaerobaculia bacterium]|nr:PAS domain S-box protein [Thermoanaerobaculia bacterium]